MTSSGLGPAPRVRLADLAHQALRRSIIDGSLAMGERLKEPEIAHQLNMSRAPVREAIQRLAAEGLVVQEPHMGAHVLKLAPEDIADLYNVRMGLETTALRLYLVRATGYERLSQLMKDMSAAAAQGDVEGVVAAEVDWHRTIIESSGSDLLRHIFRDLEGRVRLVAYLEDRIVRSPANAGTLAAHLQYIVSEHLAITEAIVAGEHDTAITLFEEHFVSTVDTLIEQLDGDPSLLLRAGSKPVPNPSP